MRNIYKELDEQIKDSKLDEITKKKLQLDLFGIFLSEQLHNQKFIEDYNKLKQTVLEQFKIDFDSLDKTKVALYKQATETYYPSLCDSSQLGTRNEWYLHLSNTLFNDKLFLVNSEGEIVPILWNIATCSGRDIELDDELTNELLEFCNNDENRDKHWTECINLWLENKLGVSEYKWDNTYNYDGIFVLEFCRFNMNDDIYFVIQVHIGADIRGGYSSPKVYRSIDIEEFPAIFDSWESVGFYCPNCHEHRFYYEKINREFKNGQWICSKLIEEDFIINGLTQKTLDNRTAKRLRQCNTPLQIIL